MNQLSEFLLTQLTIEPWRMPVVVISGVGIYLSFILLVRIFGSRVLAKMTTFDAVVIVMFGAVAGRVIIGHPPTLAAGIIGLITLMCCEALFGMARNVRGIKRAIDGRPRVLVAHGEIIEAQLRRTHLHIADIKHAVRRAGVASLRDIQLMILEPTGEMSIFKTGPYVDLELLTGVAGVHFYTKALPRTVLDERDEPDDPDQTISHVARIRARITPATRSMTARLQKQVATPWRKLKTRVRKPLK